VSAKRHRHANPRPPLPARRLKVEFRSANVLPGGQVATAMVACQSWGLRTRYVGKVGDDLAATLHRSEFASHGVETHLLTAQAAPASKPSSWSTTLASAPSSGSATTA